MKKIIKKKKIVRHNELQDPYLDYGVEVEFISTISWIHVLKYVNHNEILGNTDVKF